MSPDLNLKSILVVLLTLSTSASLQGCAVLVGAGAATGGYEAKQASEMEQLEKDYKAGKISHEEYEARKQQIDDASITQ